MTNVECRGDDFRSSKLETGLSSNAESLCKKVDTTMLKLSSSSSLTPLHDFSIFVFFKGKALERI